MRSLKKLNAAAGTSYTRWEQVVEALKHETAKSFSERVNEARVRLERRHKEQG